MTLIPSYFRVSIDATGLGGAAPADGFIDPTKAEDYNSLPTTKANAEAKERANLRWKELLQRVSSNIAPIHVLDIVATGATHDAPATALEFSLVFDRPEYLSTEDEDNPGTILSGADSIQREIARSMISSLTKQTYMAGTLVSKAADAETTGIVELEVGALAADLATAEGAITVTEIANT